MNQIRNQFYEKESCQPQKIPISSLLQFPAWVYLSTSIRNLAFGTGSMHHKNALYSDKLNLTDFVF
jgi:hypothetical protein